MEVFSMENYLTEFELNDAKFIMGEGCLCFQPVIETFKTAKFINILTYNISSSSNELLNALKQAGQNNIPIRIITNIPSRWPRAAFFILSERSKNIVLQTTILHPVSRPDGGRSGGQLPEMDCPFTHHGTGLQVSLP